MTYRPNIPAQGNLVRTSAGDLAYMQENFDELAPIISGHTVEGTAPSAGLKGWYFGDDTNRKRYYVRNGASDNFRIQRNINTEASPSWESVMSFGQATGTDITMHYKVVGVTPTSSSHLATKGYVDSATLSGLTDTSVSGVTSGEYLRYNGSEWGYGIPQLNDLIDVSLPSPTSGDTLVYNGAQWEALSHSLSGLTDTSVSGATSGQVLTYDGSNWTAAATAVDSLSGLTDTSVSGATSGQGLIFDGADWVDNYIHTYKDVRNYGNDVQAAIDDTSTFRSTYFPPGTYVVSGLSLASGDELWLARGAVIQLASGVAANVITVSGDDVTIRGLGTIDGNRAEQTASGNVGILVNGFDRLSVTDVYVTGCPAQGIFIIDSDDSSVVNCRVDDTGATGIAGYASASELNNLRVEGCRVDRSDDAANDAGGIKIHEIGSTTVWRPIVSNCKVLMHKNPTGSNVVGIELWGSVRAGKVVGCTVSGSSIGISVANGSYGCSVSASDVYEADSIGIEVADSAGCVVAGCVVDGEGNTGIGISVDGTNLVTSGNSITGNTVRGAVDKGILVYNSNAAYTSVVGNAVDATVSGSKGIYTLETSQVTIVGNTLPGNGFGNQGINVNNGSDVTIQGNQLRSWQRGIQLTANNEAHDYVDIDGNIVLDMSVNTIIITEQGSGTYGNHVTVGRNPGYSFGALELVESLRYKADGNDMVFRGVHSATPEGSITAEAGSFLQVYGTANPAALAFFKSTTSGNTGWLPIQPIDFGDTASRPTGLGAAGTGFSYFDTDLGCPVWWDGSGWVMGAPIEVFELSKDTVASGDSYTLSLYAFYAYDVNELRAITSAGTCDLTFEIDGTAIAGLSGVTVSGTESNYIASSAYSVAVGNTLSISVEDASACSGLMLSLKTTRTT